MSTTQFKETADELSTDFIPITVSQFREMIRSGIVPDGAPIELIDGMMFKKDQGSSRGQQMGHDPRHALLVKRLIRILQAWVSSVGCHLQSQLPVTLTATTELEPDVAIILGTEEDFDSRHPGPGDVAVAIEVADSSLRRDQTRKLGHYATAGIPVYWIVYLQANQIEVYKGPDSERHTYTILETFHAGEILELEIQGLKLAIDPTRLLV